MMRKPTPFIVLMVVLAALLILLSQPAIGQTRQTNLNLCREFGFSVEEDFLTNGPVPADGNPIISDGDLLGPNCAVCARNRDLVQNFDVTVDLGLDAVDILDVDHFVVAFSTELDSPNRGQFGAGDLLVTAGDVLGVNAIIPNLALLNAFGVHYDLGLDAVQFIGDSGQIINFLKEAARLGKTYWVENPGALADSLRQYKIDIWFSTEGSGPYVQVEKGVAPLFLDGDVLSARDGAIVIPNSALLPPSVPAGLPQRGVDFGLDALAASRVGDPRLTRFSTEILYNGKVSFTDGDLLGYGNGVVMANEDLVRCFEPKAAFVGLDAFSLPEQTRPPCGAAIIKVGGMPVGSIGPNGLANGLSATTPQFEAMDSPFGGTVQIIGLMPDCDQCTEFKVEYGAWATATTPPATWVPITDKFKEWAFIWPSWYILETREPAADGYLDILCNTTMGGLYMPWNTAGKNGKYSLRLTVKDSGGIEHVSAPVVVMLDNKAPTASLTVATTPICGDIFAGDIVTGTITATDDHFYSYRLRYISSLASGDIIPVRKYTGVTDTGDASVTWTWDTTGLPACGYRIRLEVWDRTIVNNGRAYGEPGFGHLTPIDQYFCLETAMP